MNLGLGLGVDKARPIGAVTVPQDSSADAFFLRSGVTDPTQKSAVTNFVIALKAAGLWAKITALWPYVGGTEPKHTFNLMSASYPLVFFGTWNHNAAGAHNNGGYASTGLSPSFYGANDTAFGFYQMTDAGNTAPDIGAMDGNTFQIYAPYTNNFTYLDNGQTPARMSVGLANELGMISVSRYTPGEVYGYRNGTQIATLTSAGQGTVPATNFFIGNNSAVGGTVKSYGMHFISVGLTAVEIANFYTAVQNYQTALSRAVAP